jgi:hypothetical protein
VREKLHLILVYVDNILIASTDEGFISEIKKEIYGSKEKRGSGFISLPTDCWCPTICGYVHKAEEYMHHAS